VTVLGLLERDGDGLADSSLRVLEELGVLP
jgi:hypothetical protein